MEPNLHSLNATPDAVPEAERRPILLRAYAEASIVERRSRKASKPPEWLLVFDTETTSDESQRLRFGTFQLWGEGQLEEKGIFYGAVEPDELATLAAEAARHGCTLRSVEEFVDRIFFPAAFKVGALVVGLNLAFDLSRLAIDHDAARVARAPRNKEEIEAGAPLKKSDRFMVGGFTFRLSPSNDQPFLRIKHRNSRSSFFSFAKPKIQELAPSQLRRGQKIAFQRGNFLDVRTLAAALTSTSHGLGSLAKYLGVKHKGEFTDFARKIDAEFIEYALDDTEVTRQCFGELERRYARHGLRTPPQRISSEAGLGKAYLNDMGVKPWREVQKDFDPASIGAIMSSYFGGRAEVHIRRTITPTLYCDFASMYPTVCTLMGLWRFVIARGVDEEDSTAETQSYLDTVQVVDLQNPESWGALTTLVQVRPAADIFPVRARYAPQLAGDLKSGESATIGLNYLSADRPLWFTLADCIASKLLTGRAPKVLRAIRFRPKPPQNGLKPIKIYGKPEFRVEPAKDDFYKRVIELRRRVKGELAKAEERDPESQESKNLDMDQFALKILANATSYGIFIELNVEDCDVEEGEFPIHASQGERRVQMTKREQPGQFYHPLLATLITGAARLMLALTERLAFDNGLNWVFCDTDSMAFANTGKLSFDEFVKRVQEICKWFEPLNPYEADPKKGLVSILEMEKENYRRGKGLEPLFCFAISAKRYALFNLDAEGKPVIRKASAHGLGHIVAPYGSEEQARKEQDSGVRLWEEGVWRAILSAALGPNPRSVDFAFRPEMSEPARSRYGATRPAVLDWFKRFNEGRSYAEQVKPFNFLLSFFARRQEDLLATDPANSWDPKLEEMRPVAPYEKNLSKALPRVFDRSSDELKPVPAEWLRTVAEVLRDYHRQPEYKFLGGGWNEEGILRRRHVFAERIEDIGKEADGWEEDDARTEDQDTVLTYPPSSTDRERMVELIKSVGKRELAREAKIAMRAIGAIYNRGENVSDAQLKRMANAAERIERRRREHHKNASATITWLKSQSEEIGLVALASSLRVDAANLAKVISGKRAPSKALLADAAKLTNAPNT
ncbi:hypothetical protein [Methylocella sp.]|jgi:hypothetical protein|uniref:hypothetical protein n=1 Tax=Methylocella sp. TaxID=1978226 RepID=UPI003C1DD288